VRDVRALTLFVGNNRLQLAQLGMQPQAQSHSQSALKCATPGEPVDACITAVMLKPISAMSMIRLMLHGAMGTLGEAQSVEHFNFSHMVVRPTLAHGRRAVKVAFDGEVALMRAPLDFRVLAQPLYLLMPDPPNTVADADGSAG
jgi:diacylglycerol kinase family enzyme